ncbi:MAG: hypothetical protein JWO36_3847 [Myxococcales bacterium]|nr:hypothetical protein [Myxococcales bacterium]
MRAVMIPDHEWLAERARLGLDNQDEVWDGVLHMPPQPGSDHQRRESDLEFILKPRAAATGLDVFHQISIFGATSTDAKQNYRIPDITVVDPQFVSKRGVETRAEIVIEILSPNDESRDKLPFFAACGIPEVWLFEPSTRAIEVYVLRGEVYFAIMADRAGVVRAPRLDLELTVVEGPRLRVSWADGSTEI